MQPFDPFPVPAQPVEMSGWRARNPEGFIYDSLEVWGGRENPGYRWGYFSRRQATLKALTAVAPPPARILDLAAAQGNFSITLARMGYRVTWNDLRSELQPYVQAKLPADVPMDFLTGNIFELGEAYHGQFDVVLATEVIEHVAHPDDFLAKLAKLAKPGGHLVISTPNGGYFMNDLPRFTECPDPSVFESVQFKPNSDGHIFLLYEDELNRFAKAYGLKVLSLDLITTPLTAGHIKMRHVLKLLPDSAVCALERAGRRLPHRLRSLLCTHIVTVMQRPHA